MTSVEELSLEDNIAEAEEHYGPEESPTKRQLETIKKLSGDLNKTIDYDNLTKRSAGTLIGRLLEEKKK